MPDVAFGVYSVLLPDARLLYVGISRGAADTSRMGRLPKWAQWQADNPPTGFDARLNRRAWTSLAWGVRLWLAFAVIMVLAAIIGVVALLVEAL